MMVLSQSYMDCRDFGSGLMELSSDHHLQGSLFNCACDASLFLRSAVMFTIFMFKE